MSTGPLGTLAMTLAAWYNERDLARGWGLGGAWDESLCIHLQIEGILLE